MGDIVDGQITYPIMMADGPRYNFVQLGKGLNAFYRWSELRKGARRQGHSLVALATLVREHNYPAGARTRPETPARPFDCFLQV